MVKISNYNFSVEKRLLDIAISFLVLFFFLPGIILIIMFEFFKKGSIIFRQQRIGRAMKKFVIYKFRTMKLNSEKTQTKYSKLNEADGPVFKINKDPRFTKLGYFLSHSGLDELPQIINVLKNEMSLVGPRPLPTYEFNKLNKDQKVRNLIKPGITSLWVINGSHQMLFKKWMELDKKYVSKSSLLMDLRIIFQTLLIPLKILVKKLEEK